MKLVQKEELRNFKILPYDLYNEANVKIMNAGEVLTPGKLIMLKNYVKIYTDDPEEAEQTRNPKDLSKKDNLKKLLNFTYDSLNPADFETVTNKCGILKNDVQVRVKFYYKKTLDLFIHGYYSEGLDKLSTLVNIMLSDIFKQLSKSSRGSQTRFLGEYEICHPINVAITGGLIAKRLEYTNNQLEQVILAGLLHDIGKILINLPDQSALLTTNEEEVMQHTKLGYDLIKTELDLGEDIALAALEHHENNDGSGYPQAISGDNITEMSSIISVANYYDNLACNRTPINITNNKDSLRAMLEAGTGRFAAKTLYTFIHMFNYDDPKSFNEMVG